MESTEQTESHHGFCIKTPDFDVAVGERAGSNDKAVFWLRRKGSEKGGGRQRFTELRTMVGMAACFTMIGNAAELIIDGLSTRAFVKPRRGLNAGTCFTATVPPIASLSKAFSARFESELWTHS